MRFLIDENGPLAVATALRELGNDCFLVAEQTASAPDEDVIARARREDRILITFDADFGRMIFRELAPAPPGVVYMQSRPQHASLVGALFLSLFRSSELDPISHRSGRCPDDPASVGIPNG